MTDTGRFPGEGQPENAGALPGHPLPADAPAPADTGSPAPYTFLDQADTADEDDLLLMPGAQGAWMEQPTLQGGGTHESGGRDTGSVDFTGVRTQPPAAPAAPTASSAARRPLHMGPPVPDPSSGGVVRSLADRGPAAPQPPAGPAVPQADAVPTAPAAEPVVAFVPSQNTGGVTPAGGAADSIVAGAGTPAGGAEPVQPPAEAAVPVQAAPVQQAPETVAAAPVAAAPEPAAPVVEEPAPQAPAVVVPEHTAPVQEEPAQPAAPAAPEPVAAPAHEEPAQQAATPVVAPDQVAPAAGESAPQAEAEAAPQAVQPVQQPVVAESAPAQNTAPAQTEPVEQTAGQPAAPEPIAAVATQEPAPVQEAPSVSPEPVPASPAPAQEMQQEPVQAAPVEPTAPQPAAQEEPVPAADVTVPVQAVPVQDEPVVPVAAEAAVPAEAPSAVPEPAVHAPAAPEAPSATPVDAPEQAAAEPEPAAAAQTEPELPEPAPAAQQPAPAQTEPTAAPDAVAEPSQDDVPQTGPEATAVPPAAVAQHPESAPGPTAPAADAPEPEQDTPVQAEPVTEAAPAAVPEPVPAHPEPAVPAAQEAVAPEQDAPARTEPAPVAEAQPQADAAPEAAEPDAQPPAAAEPAGPPADGYAAAEREAVHRVMRERRDIRKGFRTDPIPHEVLLRVLEAAHTAPSVGHSQPWDFVVIRSAETRRTMHELATRQRDAYAKSLPKARAKQFKELKIEAILDTPVNIVVTADPTRGGRHTLGRHTQPQMAPYSSALAVENLWLAARAEGLGVGWVSFFDEREMVRALGLPEHLEVVAYLCIGYVDEFPDEPELLQAGWSKRRPLSWVVHEETYGRRALPGEDPHDLLAETLRGIRPLDAKALGEAWERQKRMTKPSGALGMLEIISAQLCGLSRKCPPPIPEPAAVAIFAGDHGVHHQGVTAWPQEVTAQMVANFLGGGAVCNAFANQVGAEVCVVDVGVAAELPSTPGLLPRKIRPGTSDFTTGPAMTREEALRAVETGIETARDLVTAGNKALLTGEMGIANTTVSAALISVYTGADPAEITGRGTGINDEMHARKVDVVRRALELHQPDPDDPIGVLAAVGGLEHAAMVGLILGGASLRTPVILDGVSAGAAALVARAIAPEALAACIAGHRSAEPGHVAALTKLGLRPLVDLDLRLGEGTGALLALPVVQSAARAMHEVATFDTAGVTEKG
ncbi:nicotinate-nucleotide--dimethylbenzimidazole phosphoribosyltransferase [Streptomyces sp. ET3-23]|uniref:nicotinate-nucleotide--dimethylbenzimidazole phosphoribosyltransferase n=1 Tax=Streptomyces sp. ET3-23 TaxID=2885643 RepID=UPI001D10BED2|nr:nicotinate-nucleotide--dimethylbenzimidazole phosphoribosyltransferase [Streptomyces sp. ET3-23]MCC2276462.1 nicotinate-nucleotide--dimethylbenzimidazole phosphoribosyltransferase [Streptomyces sp. ET3-23]